MAVPPPPTDIFGFATEVLRLAGEAVGKVFGWPDADEETLRNVLAPAWRDLAALATAMGTAAGEQAGKMATSWPDFAGGAFNSSVKAFAGGGLGGTGELSTAAGRIAQSVLDYAADVEYTRAQIKWEIAINLPIYAATFAAGPGGWVAGMAARYLITRGTAKLVSGSLEWLAARAAASTFPRAVGLTPGRFVLGIGTEIVDDLIPTTLALNETGKLGTKFGNEQMAKSTIGSTVGEGFSHFIGKPIRGIANLVGRGLDRVGASRWGQQQVRVFVQSFGTNAFSSTLSSKVAEDVYNGNFGNLLNVQDAAQYVKDGWLSAGANGSLRANGVDTFRGFSQSASNALINRFGTEASTFTPPPNTPPGDLAKVSGGQADVGQAGNGQAGSGQAGGTLTDAGSVTDPNTSRLSDPAFELSGDQQLAASDQLRSEQGESLLRPPMTTSGAHSDAGPVRLGSAQSAYHDTSSTLTENHQPTDQQAADQQATDQQTVDLQTGDQQLVDQSVVDHHGIGADQTIDAQGNEVVESTDGATANRQGSELRLDDPEGGHQLSGAAPGTSAPVVTPASGSVGTSAGPVHSAVGSTAAAAPTQQGTAPTISAKLNVSADRGAETEAVDTTHGATLAGEPSLDEATSADLELAASAEAAESVAKFEPAVGEEHWFGASASLAGPVGLAVAAGQPVDEATRPKRSKMPSKTEVGPVARLGGAVAETGVRKDDPPPPSDPPVSEAEEGAGAEFGWFDPDSPLIAEEDQPRLGAINLPSPQTYRGNTAEWISDSKGRPRSVRAHLVRAFDGRGRRYADKVAQALAGKLGGVPKDEGGHALAWRFFKMTVLENLFPQNKNLNTGAYKKVENEWAAWLNAGFELDVTVSFPPGQIRPSTVTVTYTVQDSSGRTVWVSGRTFINQAGEVFNRYSRPSIESFQPGNDDLFTPPQGPLTAPPVDDPTPTPPPPSPAVRSWGANRVEGGLDGELVAHLSEVHPQPAKWVRGPLAHKLRRLMNPDGTIPGWALFEGAPTGNVFPADAIVPWRAFGRLESTLVAAIGRGNQVTIAFDTNPDTLMLEATVRVFDPSTGESSIYRRAGITELADQVQANAARGAIGRNPAPSRPPADPLPKPVGAPGQQRHEVEPDRYHNGDPDGSLTQELADRVGNDPLGNVDDWIQYGNPHYQTDHPSATNNCADNARAFADTLQGREPRLANRDLRSGVDEKGVNRFAPGETSEMWEYTGIMPDTIYVPGATNAAEYTAGAYDQIRASLEGQPPGTVAMIVGRWASSPGSPPSAHWFNAFVDTTGVVRWADMQSGETGGFPPAYRARFIQVGVLTRQPSGEWQSPAAPSMKLDLVDGKIVPTQNPDSPQISVRPFDPLIATGRGTVVGADEHQPAVDRASPQGTRLERNIQEVMARTTVANSADVQSIQQTSANSYEIQVTDDVVVQAVVTTGQVEAGQSYRVDIRPGTVPAVVITVAENVRRYDVAPTMAQAVAELGLRLTVGVADPSLLTRKRLLTPTENQDERSDLELTIADQARLANLEQRVADRREMGAIRKALTRDAIARLIESMGLATHQRDAELLRGLIGGRARATVHAFESQQSLLDRRLPTAVFVAKVVISSGVNSTAIVAAVLLAGGTPLLAAGMAVPALVNSLAGAFLDRWLVGKKEVMYRPAYRADDEARERDYPGFRRLLGIAPAPPNDGPEPPRATQQSHYFVRHGGAATAGIGAALALVPLGVDPVSAILVLGLAAGFRAWAERRIDAGKFDARLRRVDHMKRELENDPDTLQNQLLGALADLRRRAERLASMQGLGLDHRAPELGDEPGFPSLGLHLGAQTIDQIPSVLRRLLSAGGSKNADPSAAGRPDPQPAVNPLARILDAITSWEGLLVAFVPSAAGALAGAPADAWFMSKDEAEGDRRRTYETKLLAARSAREILEALGSQLSDLDSRLGQLEAEAAQTQPGSAPDLADRTQDRADLETGVQLRPPDAPTGSKPSGLTPYWAWAAQVAAVSAAAIGTTLGLDAVLTMENLPYWLSIAGSIGAVLGIPASKYYFKNAELMRFNRLNHALGAQVANPEMIDRTVARVQYLLEEIGDFADQAVDGTTPAWSDLVSRSAPDFTDRARAAVREARTANQPGDNPAVDLRVRQERSWGLQRIESLAAEVDQLVAAGRTGSELDEAQARLEHAMIVYLRITDNAGVPPYFPLLEGVDPAKGEAVRGGYTDRVRAAVDEARRLLRAEPRSEKPLLEERIDALWAIRKAADLVDVRRPLAERGINHRPLEQAERRLEEAIEKFRTLSAEASIPDPFLIAPDIDNGPSNPPDSAPDNPAPDNPDPGDPDSGAGEDGRSEIARALNPVPRPPVEVRQGDPTDPQEAAAGSGTTSARTGVPLGNDASGPQVIRGVARSLLFFSGTRRLMANWEAVEREIHAALARDDVLAAAEIESVTRRPSDPNRPDVLDGNRYLVTPKVGAPFELNVRAATVDGGHPGEFVVRADGTQPATISVSARSGNTSVARTMANLLHQLAHAGRPSEPPVLRPGSNVKAEQTMSREDGGRLAEARLLDKELDTTRRHHPLRKQNLRNEIRALMEHLGVANGQQDAQYRRSLLAGRDGPMVDKQTRGWVKGDERPRLRVYFAKELAFGALPAVAGAVGVAVATGSVVAATGWAAPFVAAGVVHAVNQRRLDGHKLALKLDRFGARLGEVAKRHPGFYRLLEADPFGLVGKPLEDVDPDTMAPAESKYRIRHLGPAVTGMAVAFALTPTLPAMIVPGLLFGGSAVLRPMIDRYADGRRLKAKMLRFEELMTRAATDPARYQNQLTDFLAQLERRLAGATDAIARTGTRADGSLDSLDYRTLTRAELAERIPGLVRRFVPGTSDPNELDPTELAKAISTYGELLLFAAANNLLGALATAGVNTFLEAKNDEAIHDLVNFSLDAMENGESRALFQAMRADLSKAVELVSLAERLAESHQDPATAKLLPRILDRLRGNAPKATSPGTPLPTSSGAPLPTAPDQPELLVDSDLPSARMPFWVHTLNVVPPLFTLGVVNAADHFLGLDPTIYQATVLTALAQLIATPIARWAANRQDAQHDLHAADANNELATDQKQLADKLGVLLFLTEQTQQAAQAKADALRSEPSRFSPANVARSIDVLFRIRPASAEFTDYVRAAVRAARLDIAPAPGENPREGFQDRQDQHLALDRIEQQADHLDDLTDAVRRGAAGARAELRKARADLVAVLKAHRGLPDLASTDPANGTRVTGDPIARTRAAVDEARRRLQAECGSTPLRVKRVIALSRIRVALDTLDRMLAIAEAGGRKQGVGLALNELARTVNAFKALQRRAGVPGDTQLDAAPVRKHVNQRLKPNQT